MKIRSLIQISSIAIGSLLILGCSPLDYKHNSQKAEKAQKTENTEKTQQAIKDHKPMTFGNSENVKVIKNPIMMFHDIIVSQTTDGAKLEGKIHVMRRQHYVPGHIDIAIIDNETGKNISVISTDFNSRIARNGRHNFKHANNIGTRIPGVDLEKSTVIIAYHYSNVGRLSTIDCGANVALASASNKEETPKKTKKME